MKRVQYVSTVAPIRLLYDGPFQKWALYIIT